MMGRRRNIPPLRTCTRCHRDYRTWTKLDVCDRCWTDSQADRTALTDELRRRRLERREAQQ